MKNWKTFIAGLFIISLTTPTLLSQVDSKVFNFTVQSGIGNHGINANIGARLQFTPHLAIDLEGGQTSWLQKDKEFYSVRTGIKSQKITTRGGTSFGIDALAFSKSNHTGFYGGAGWRMHSYSITSNYKIEPDNDPVFGGNGGLFGFLMDATVEALDGQQVTFTDEGIVSALNLRAGYCLEFVDGTRLDMGMSLLARQAASLTHTRPGTDNILKGISSELPDDTVNPITYSLEVKYIVPLF
jgi:hypothetical protein